MPNQLAKLFLASTSKYRAAALTKIGLNFAQISPDVDETMQSSESPSALATRLAEAKAAAVATKIQANQDDQLAIIIGSDQIGICDQAVLTKPITEQRAIEQLAACSGRTAEFLTALSIFTVKLGLVSRYSTDLVSTHLQFRRLSESDISEYVRRERPLDCAGAFKAEGLGITLFEMIRAEDPSALIGLPLIKLVTRLRALNHNPLA